MAPEGVIADATGVPGAVGGLSIVEAEVRNMIDGDKAESWPLLSRARIATV